MPGELTDAGHRVRFHHSHVASGLVPAQETIRAAYVTTEDKQLPGMLVFKDRNHQVVAILSKDAVLAVERVEEKGEDRPAPGFQTTTQVMEQAGIKPGYVPSSERPWDSPGQFA